MMSCKPAYTPITIDTKLIKQDKGSSIDFTLFKRLVGNLMYLIITRQVILSLKLA